MIEIVISSCRYKDALLYGREQGKECREFCTCTCSGSGVLRQSESDEQFEELRDSAREYSNFCMTISGPHFIHVGYNLLM